MSAKLFVNSCLADEDEFIYRKGFVNTGRVQVWGGYVRPYIHTFCYVRQLK